ncbi:hypothetical protein [uncultured Pseudacidovorax sp.]|uniref:hypothetical protein n=1 Tax=uncultured Pseudacidovorax sp. TaxID=679313 RepID=UPI0025E2E5DB|nr:hypothetical protein [uncultured Pseudacidovorax sp.]
MDLQQLISEFAASPHGEQAMASLTAQGVDPGDAQDYLGHAVTAASEHAQAQQQGGSGGGHSFLAGFAAGLLHGDGFFKSLVDGGEGVLTGRIAESLANRAGLDGGTAATVAAALTPYVVAFLRQKMG